MSKLIFEHFRIHQLNLKDICDCCMTQEEFQPLFKEYTARGPTEDLFRALYNYDFIKPDQEWIKHYNQEGDIVYFTIEFERLIKLIPELLDSLPKMLNEDSKNIWNNYING